MNGVQSVVVVGNGLAAGLAGAMLATRLDSARYSVTLVGGGRDPHGLGPVGATIATRPGFDEVLATIGLGEDAVLAAADGAFTLGAAFSGWRGAAHGWMLPHGSVGAPIGSVAFHQIAHRLRAEGYDVRLADYAIAAVAAQSGRFGRRDDGDRGSVLRSLDHGMTFDTQLLATLLQQVAVGAGARIEPCEVVDVTRDDAGIRSLTVAGGGSVAGDLFIDASGTPAMLSRSAWQDWRHWFPCDRALIGSVADPEPPLGFTHGGATANGWRSSVAIDGSRGDVLFYSSAHGSSQAAEHAFGLDIDGEMHVAAGRRECFWDANCIAVGAAAAAVEPLHATELQRVASAIERLLTLFPTHRVQPVLAAEYDRRTTDEVERVRDFALLHYRLADRPEPMWRDVAQSSLPDTVAWKLDQFCSRGRIALFEDETFGQDDWVMLMDAMAVQARRRDPLCDLIPSDPLKRHVAGLRQAIVTAVRSMPTHQAALRAVKSQGNAA